MKIEGVELRWVGLPLVSPFRTSFGTETDREIRDVVIEALETYLAGKAKKGGKA